MARFRYTAIGPQGETERGVLEAASEADAIARLRRQGRMPMRAEPADGRGLSLGSRLGARFGARSTVGALRAAERAHLTRELAVMLGAGQDLDRALRFLIETATNARLGRALTALREAVRDGKPLAVALAQHPRSFPPLYVGLVRAGEAGGTLASTLDHLAALLERERALAASISTAMVYPALLALAAVGAIALLLTQVLPQFVPLFEENGAALPGPTQALITAGNLVSRFGLAALLALALVGLALRAVLRRPGPRAAFDRLVLRLPVLGGMAREILAARLTRTLGTLLTNGVPLITALGIARDALGNRAGMRAVDEASQRARDGAGLAEPLRASGVLPVRTIHLLRLGEETGQLGPMALRAAEIHETASRLAIQRLVALLVPAITILMGAAIAGIVASLLLAMLSLNDLAH